MSRNVSTQQGIAEPLTKQAPIPKSGVEVEEYADRLMEELFTDVDQVLQGGSSLPNQPLKPEYIELKQIKVPQIILPPTMPDRQSAPLAVEVKTGENLRSAKAEPDNKSFDRILLGVAFTSLAITVGLWFISRSNLTARQAEKSPQNMLPPPVDLQAEANNQFVDYVQKSINAIDQKKSSQKSQIPALPNTPITTNLPTIPVPAAPPLTGNIAQALNRVAEAIEQQSTKPIQAPPAQVVVIPPAPAKQLPAPAPAPANPPSNNILAKALNRFADVIEKQTGKSPIAKNQPSAAPSAAPPRVATIPASPSPNVTAIPTVGVEPTKLSVPALTLVPPPAPPAAANTPEVQAKNSEESTVTNTLVGILSLGDRSAALFEINGVAQRIYVGENIGSSGWSLAEVKNQEAIIRKSGEVRSIFVGQKF